MEEVEREGWGRILLEKWKFLWAVISFLILDLGLVALWALVLFCFEKLIHWVDPANSFLLLVILKWFAELSTSSVVVYSIYHDFIRSVRRIKYGPKLNPAEERMLLDSKTRLTLNDEGIQQQTADRVTARRIP
jgi:hypothetical protein